jgi:hypothetical protein
MRTIPLEFINSNGLVLRGFLHEPQILPGISGKNLIVFPNGGLMGCEGDFRAYVRIARYLAKLGFYVLRISPSGLGMSNGIIEPCKRPELFIKVETGLFVEDIKAAVKYIKSQMTFDSITLAGICGGAISAFIAASQIKEVDNVIPIGIPTLLDNSEGDYDARIPVEEAKFIFKTYINKFLSPVAWLRLLMGKSDSKTIKMLIHKLVLRKKIAVETKDQKNGFTVNHEFVSASEKVFGNKKVLFIFGSADGFIWEFKNYFESKYFPYENERPYDSYVIQNANHMLTWVEMQEEAAQKISDWLVMRNRKH